MKNAEQKFRFALFLYKCIVILLAAMCVFALASCAPISTGGGYSSDGGGAVGSGGDSSGSGGSGGRNGVPITISLPAIGSTSIRALTEEQRTRLQRETAKYRVIFSGAGQTITREGTGTMYSATFPVGTQVGVTVYCVNAAGQDIVRTTTKTITVSSGANSLSFQISADGTELEHVPDNPPSPQPEPGPTPEPTPDPVPPREDRPQANVKFHPGWAYDSDTQAWEAMTTDGLTLPRNGNRDDNSPTSSEKGSKKGYVFKGWVEDANMPNGSINDIKNFVDRFLVTLDKGDVNLYGIWEKLQSENHYQVIFNVGNTPGSTVTSLPQNFQQEKNTTARIPSTPTCLGYVFTGWSANPSVQWAVKDVGISDTFTMPESDVTLTAQWTAITYKIVYYESAGQNPQNGATFTVASGGDTVQIENTDIFTIPKGYITQWENRSGETFGGTGSQLHPKLELIVDRWTAPDPDDPDNSEKRIIPLTLKLQAMPYTINVENNGATEIISNPFASNQYTVDGSIGSSVINLTALSSNQYVYSGKVFKHWSFTATGPEIIGGQNGLTLEDVLNNPSAKIDSFGSITLYPVWEDAVVSVTINGGAEQFYGTFDDAWNYADGNTATVKLYKNVSVSSSMSVFSDITLDLNGHTMDSALTDGSVFKIIGSDSATVTFTLNDTAGSGGSIYSSTGMKTCTAAVSGGGVNVGENATFIMNGGNISLQVQGPSGASSLGGGVYVDKNASFTMNGGSITNCKVSGGSSSYGGGVYVVGGTFEMTGGSITGNDAYYGGGVYTNSDYQATYPATFKMTGGEISGNKIQGNATGGTSEGRNLLIKGTVTQGGASYIGGTVTITESLLKDGGYKICSGNTYNGTLLADDKEL